MTCLSRVMSPPARGESLGISLEAARRQVEEITGQGQQAPSGHIPFTARAKKTLELSGQESTQLGSTHIDTEHILLGLLGVRESAGPRILVNLGADAGRVRQQVIDMLRGNHGQEAAAAGEPSQLRARFGSHEHGVSENMLVGALASIDERQTVIERRLGISSQPPPGPYEEQIAELRQAKEAAINRGDFAPGGGAAR